MVRSTENTTFTCVLNIQKRNITSLSVPIGKVLNNRKAYILDKASNPVPTGITGKLLHRRSRLSKRLPKPTGT